MEQKGISPKMSLNKIENLERAQKENLKLNVEENKSTIVLKID